MKNKKFSPFHSIQVFIVVVTFTAIALPSLHTSPRSINEALPASVSPLPDQAQMPRPSGARNHHPSGIQPLTDAGQVLPVSIDTNELSSTHSTGSLTSKNKQSGSASSLPSPNDKLIRFDTSTARTEFMTINHLSSADLAPLPELNAYRVQAPDLTLNPGSRLFENQPYHMALTPTDPGFSAQSYLNRVNVVSAWNSQIGSASVKIADIDTGFGIAHQDLADHWARNAGETGPTDSEGPAPNCTSRGLALDKSCNNIDDDGNGLTDDSLGWNFTDFTPNVQAGLTNPAGSGVSHGTMTAGVIGATGNNASGITGVMWRSSLLPIQALDDDGNGSTISVAYSIRYAVDQGAQVINLSLGSNGDDPLVSEQISYALGHNVIVVAAAGNDGCDCISYPARYDGVISVGALTTASRRASFSSFGTRLDLTAPGTSICSTAWQESNQTSSYTCGLAGTSFSSPLTAGTVGLLLAQHPGLTPTQVRSVLLNSASKLSAMNGANWTASYGYGQLNAFGALGAVSLATPTGLLLNTHTLKLSQLNSGYQAYLADNLNSSCISNISSAICHVRAINNITNEIVPLSSNETTDGLTNLYWQASSNLTTGQWLIQGYAVAGGVQSLVQEELLTINP